MKEQLPRTKQCSKCPWKVSTNPFEIPDGYCELKHANLKNTIANDGEINIGKPVSAMACHHSKGEDKMYCIGWLNHQLGVGNNIGLKIQMMNYSNVGDIKTYGKQHQKFEDTLPSILTNQNK